MIAAMIASTSLAAFSTATAATPVGRTGAAPTATPQPIRAASTPSNRVASAAGAGADNGTTATGAPDRAARRGSRLDILA